jgi:hypothetical protein
MADCSASCVFSLDVTLCITIGRGLAGRPVTMIDFSRTGEQTWRKHGLGMATGQSKEITKTPGQYECAARDLNPRIKSPMFCARLMPDNARRCRYVRDSAYFAAISCRTLTYRTATAEQTWSKHGDGHVPKRPIHSVIIPASGRSGPEPAGGLGSR